MEKEIKTEFKKINTTLEGLVKFLHKDIPTRQEMSDLLKEKADKTDINKILSSVDGLAKQVTIYHQEMLVLSRRLDRIEVWIRKIEAKTGIKVDW
ncbi:MAG: hypothetical protein WC794_01640 [Candidatus Doudnabacteria bacterium]|jgi:hypothetical protein